MKKNHDSSKAKRGPVLRTPPGKTRITIRIDDDVLEWFRKQVHAAGGGNYQTMMNKALRNCMKRQDESFEATLRRVLREVIPGSTRGRKTAPRRTSKRRARTTHFSSSILPPNGTAVQLRPTALAADAGTSARRKNEVTDRSERAVERQLQPPVMPRRAQRSRRL